MDSHSRMSYFSQKIVGIKESIFPINRNLLMLKLSFFFVHSIWMCVLPYTALISTKIVNYKELAITFTSIPVSSILGPIVTGFLADKVGNYKIILICTVLLGGLIHLPVAWLMPKNQSNHYYNATNCNLPESMQNSSSNVTTFLENCSQNLQPIQEIYIFPILMAIRILGFFAVDSTNTLLDSCGLAIAKKEGADFGRQKMFATCTMIVIPIICGRLIDFMSDYHGFRDYSIAFYMGVGFSIIAVSVICQLEVEVQKNKKSLVKTARAVIGMADVDVFMLVQIVVGICWGLHMNFFSVYVEVELGASKTLFGAAWSLSGIGSVIVLFVSKSLINRFGEANKICFGLLCYSIRFISYYFLRNPWIILLIESLDGLSGFLSLVAGNYYCSLAAPPGMLASLNGLLAAAVFGAGRGLGTTIGAVTVASAHGIRSGYLVFGILAAVTSVAYLISYHSCLKKMEIKRLEPVKTTDTKMVGVDNPVMVSDEIE